MLDERAGGSAVPARSSSSHGLTDLVLEPPVGDPWLALATGPLTADLCECDALCECGVAPPEEQP